MLGEHPIVLIAIRRDQLANPLERARALVAANVGPVRLIDNLALDGVDTPDPSVADFA